jgi:hypothetical protein
MLAAQRALRVLVAATALAAAGGCATITRGLTQDVQIATDPIGAACELRNNHGQVVDAIPTTPGYVRVRKGIEGYVVACSAAGYLDATTPLESGIDQGGVGSLTLGALSGLQGTAVPTIANVALGTVMPAATAATAAMWLGVVGAVSFVIDIASGAAFEYATGVALTLVPSSFPTGTERDLFFDREEKRLRDQHAARRRALVEDCRLCTGAIAALDESHARELAELERLRANAQISGARGP